MKDVVLIVEDDLDIVEILSLYLSGSDYEIRTAQDGQRALAILREEDVSVALVDIMMPTMNGYDFIKSARAFSAIPIIILSARGQAADKMLGLDLGADGYITKPFDPMEVMAYIRAVLRRCAQGAPGDTVEDEVSVLVVGALEFDVEKLLLRKDGKIVPLTAAELKIMMRFVKSPNRVFTKAQLYESVNGELCPGGEESIMVHISNIRAKLEEDPLNPVYIKTVRGLGYRLEG